ncbi:MAG: MgtC/SapB family protein [Clostridia bacterium]|nr:MgtC/SapB family protein [Clostridia bacterium]
MGWQRIIQSLPIEAVYLVRILLAGLCGMVLGIERSKRQKEAGVRTHFIVACASSLLMTVSLSFTQDAARIAAQIVAGIGFLCAGMIFFRRETLHGLTTAAGVWATAGIGMAMGNGLYLLAIGTMLVIVIGQSFFHATRIGRFNIQQLLLVKFRYSEETKNGLQEYFKSAPLSRFSLTSKDGILLAEAVLRPQIACTVENISNAMEQFPDVTSIGRMEDL